MSFIIKYGVVSEVKKGFVRVNFEEDKIVSDWLPVLVRKSKSQKESWQLEANEHVVCLMDDHCEEGVVVGAIPNSQDAPDPGEGPGKFRKKFSDGTVLEYDINEHKLTVDVKGEIDAKATGKASVVAPNIELTGAVKVIGALMVTGAATVGGLAVTGGGSATVDGDIATTGGITATGDVVAGTKSLKTHVHTGVQTGGGVTGPPQ